MFKNIKKQFQDEILKIKESGMYKDEKIIEGMQGTEIKVEGKTFLNFCANNYLGLASSRELINVAKKNLDNYGFGMASVRFICGNSTVHKDLENEISKFFGTSDALLYTSCFDANAGLFEAILKEGDAVLSDELNHASIVDGVRLCKADRFIYKHSDMQDLEDKLKSLGQRNKILIASDGVFSMDGDTAKVVLLCDLAEKYRTMLMIDDSHASGVLGQSGRGSVEGLMDRVDILTSTFGKALGGAGGGFTTGRKEIIEYLKQKSRTSLFSNNLPPMIAGAALYILSNFDKEFNSLRQKLIENTKYFRDQMQSLDFNLGGDGSHPITPVMLFDEKLTTDMAQKLFLNGIYVRGFTYPVVPKGKARIRIQLSSSHTKEQIDKAIEIFAKIGKEMGVIK
ncbi:MAG: glycine C-acetyltransferase [Candidatus Staskawiczbacteria bacterium RIFCSPHIGHO2_02_FULL_34_10]|uniref:Glycine C-acetyltransferase n=1 Tax=Candidatus Staskawiczbacteria bacterium RIFCSPHIGHO2_02_FULL_34_10 TaxID=1802205 RepID=A0A1G2HZ95_9BACT|nr:MAG: glycine C-acetyltransferase [Candidatus Staskawiczbacteria bacterium RIFCSPHIGHO2_02_FULL_34_10]